MKTLLRVLFLLCILVFAGCMAENVRRANRTNLIAYLQLAYPETWEDKLYQHDMQEKLRKEIRTGRTIDQLGQLNRNVQLQMDIDALRFEMSQPQF